MALHSADEHFLRRALDLARQSIGLASPNPHVGAVVVDSSSAIAGEGFHTYDGVKHAEVIALDQAGERARGGTLYINLEPHCHQSRNPPCTDALIAAGIKRVVASMADPNPAVSGRGFEQLRAAGIAVEVGAFEAEARRLNEAFTRWIRHRVPLVTLKSAMTLDAKIKIAPAVVGDLKRETGTPPGGWITGEQARAHVKEQRHQSDAILAGIGTILADDPLLTDRSGKPRRRPLLRVVLDSQLRVPLSSRLAQSAAAAEDVLVFHSLGQKRSSAQNEKKYQLEKLGVRVEEVPATTNGRLDIQAVLRRLGELEITSLLIEGGSTVNQAALTAGVVDKVFFYYAPHILGEGAVPFAQGAPGDERLRINKVRTHRFGDDIAIEGYLRDPYAE
jgi:diaminohydroxyphosphoribosylaminopyrimidine deaminase/5-amino-6-(5-phosphoribosylamino)uracil reductase